MGRPAKVTTRSARGNVSAKATPDRNKTTRQTDLPSLYKKPFNKTGKKNDPEPVDLSSDDDSPNAGSSQGLGNPKSMEEVDKTIAE